MAKVGVFGGSFNPIHEGHISFLQQVRNKLNLDEILLVVCKNALHKSVNLVPECERVAMCKLATRGLPYIKVSDLKFEIDRNGYSIYTLQQIKNQNKGKELFLIVGPDSFLKINAWSKFSSIVEMAKIVSGYSNDDERVEMEQVASHFNFEPVLLKLNLKPFHSTKIRIQLAQGLSVESYLNPEVFKHILEQKLFCDQNLLIVECENACRNLVSKNRFNHCVFVSKMAVQLAKVYGESAFYAKIAGVLHDIVKEQTPGVLSKILKMDPSCSLSYFERNNPKLWHAPAGAIYCNKVLGLQSKQVLSAIACHTTGKPNMTNFEKIVYVSDNISLDRKSFNARVGRKMAFKSLNRTVLFTLKNHLQACCKKNLFLLSSSIDCYNQLIMGSKFFKQNQTKFNKQSQKD